MSQWVLPLESPDVTLSNGGGKAANLARLVQARFQVPRGFVVTTDAYRAFVDGNGYMSVLESIWARLDADDLATFEAGSQQVRSLFIEGKFPDEIRAAILDAYEQRIPLDAPVAVRSSATAEDLPGASFAGQQESYLGIVGNQALLAAVVRCWSSLWTARAMAYRLRQGIAPADVSMGVVVQKMVPARIAGVLFTVNPIDGNASQIVINATWGLGSILVEGQVTPDTYVADKETGAVIDTKLADKGVKVVVEAGVLQEVDVEWEQRRRPCLSELHVSALAKAGQQIEALFAAPQDVEWAIEAGKLYILQSRPITAAGAQRIPEAPGDDEWPPLSTKPPRPYDLWTRSDLGERWPDPVTPLTWSTWKPITEASMRLGFKGLRDPMLDEIEWMQRVHGHAYLNEGALAHALYHGFGMPASSFAEGMGSIPDLQARYNGYRWGTLLRRLPLLVRMTLRWNRQIKQFERDFPQIDAWVDAFMRQDRNALDDRALWSEAQEIWLDRMMTYLEYHSAVTSSSLNAYSQMEGLLRRWVGDASLIHPLVTGLTGVHQAEIVPALQSIARALVVQGLDGVVRDHAPEEAWRELRRRRHARAVVQEIDRFLRRHGHRCASEAEWLYPRWIEEPSLVIAQIQGYLAAGLPPEPAELPPPRWQQAAAGVEAKLNPLQRLYFRWALKRLHHLVRMRDNGQSYLVKLALPVRHLFATLAQRWCERGWLARVEDFFFLVVPEIEAVLASGSPAKADLDLQRRAVDRRRAWRHWMDQPNYPQALDAGGNPIALRTADGSILNGIAASAGVVEGTARVVLSPQNITQLQRGEILVTYATDPGWTPAFSTIGGLVLEVGGQLSHGAIVAREYGLPAVVNVPAATHKIKTGQQITVDGGAGKVYLSAETEE